MASPIRRSSILANQPHSNSGSEQSAAVEKKKHSKEKEASTSASSDRIAASALAELTDTEVEVSNLIRDATIGDAEVSDESVNPVKRINQKNNKNDPGEYTRLVSISDIPVVKINLDDLRKFASRNNIPRMRRLNKKKACDAIAQFVLKPLAAKKGRKTSSVVRKRYYNVLFSDTIVPLIASRDDSLHEKIVLEYNNSSKYNEDAYPDLPCRGSAESNSPITWEQSRKTLNDTIRDYEVCFNSWRRSGNHVGFESCIEGKQHLLYLHQFVFSFPNVFEKIAGKFLDDAFRESIGKPNSNVSHNTDEGSVKKRKRSNANNAVDERWKEFKESNTKKNNELTLLKSHVIVLDAIAKQRERKRQLLSEEAEDQGISLRQIRNKFTAYKEGREVESTNVLLSQDSVFDEAMELDGDVEALKKEKEWILLKLKRAHEEEDKENSV
mmetsp:Transcript_9670/g.24094  ORF Transcript_9670/g.24094 Transcript_9670/m.24094 type:complete len:440 (+) Transcript_9670:124-1443(+)